MSDLVERLRLLIVLDEVGSNNPLGREAADAIERFTADHERLLAEYKALGQKHDVLFDLLTDYEDSHRMTVDDCGAPDEKHCSCVPSLRLEIKRLMAERDQAETAVSRYDNTINERDRELVEARELLRQVGGEDWHHDAGCSYDANSIDDCDCMPGMARAFLARTEGK